jgi:hypothetical protein
MSSGPNPLAVAFSVARSLISVRPPGPFGDEVADHSLLTTPLRRLETEGPAALSDLEPALNAYLEPATLLEPKMLTHAEALAFWINVYNAGALRLAGRAQRVGADTVLGVPGGFSRKFTTIAGERLSLDGIEHGKLRRFGDPRIHAALVCGSVSCPTLRSEPYQGSSLDDQLEDQMRHFLAAGALVTEPDRRLVSLSRVFLWFGADFVKPHRMPTFLPVRRSSTLQALRPWMEPTTGEWVDATRPAVEFQGYDWGLRCSVR